MRKPLTVTPAYKERVWGGQQLGGTAEKPIGEAWLIHEDQPVQSGEFDGRTLRELTRLYPAELVGHGWTGERFPLLIKLLDCQDWLSVQVHPNDEQAAQMVGPGELGKTEAWHVLKADAKARLISGTQENVAADELARAIRAGDVASLTQEHQPQVGETLLVPAGTLHALGPGLLIYEVQQTSDTTYRVYDWDRPASAGRELHLEQSAQVARPGQAKLTPAPLTPAGADASEHTRELTRSEYFVLDKLRGSHQNGTPVKGNTDARTPHLLTVIAGEAVLTVGGESQRLGLHDTVVLPAALGEYELTGDFEALRASLPVQ